MEEFLPMITDLLQSGIMPVLLLVLRIIVLILTMYVVWRGYTSFKKGQRRKDPVIVLVDHNAKIKYPVLYWENSIGRSKSCDIVLPGDSVSRDHAVLMRRESGWIICDTDSKTGVFVNGKKIDGQKVIELGDEISFGYSTMTLMNTEEAPVATKLRGFKGFSNYAASPFKLMLITSLIHLLMAVQLSLGNAPWSLTPFIPFLILTLIGWTMYIVSVGVLRKVSFEVETFGLLLSGIGIMLTAGYNPDKLTTQIAALIIGVGIFYFLIWFMEDLERAEKFRRPVALAAIALFLLNVVLGTSIFGSKSWIMVGGFSIQPSELIKIAFIFFGASTLNKLQTKKNITEFLVFTAICLGFLFWLRDFGTALVFFVCFLIIAFMRSGSVRTIVLVLAGAVLGAVLILQSMSHVADRFSNWRHIWEDPNNSGFQQTRMLTYFASGGFFGVGMGNGYLNQIGAAESDLTFGIMSEELGILMAFLVVASLAMLSFYARSDVTRSRSTFYSISSCAAAGTILFQACLHVFGQSDIIPLTGVTLPFISVGGSSMMSIWGLLAFLKASDERTYAARRMTRKQYRQMQQQDTSERARGIKSRFAKEHLDLDRKDVIAG